MYKVDRDKVRLIRLETVTSETTRREVVELRVKGYRGLLQDHNQAWDSQDEQPNSIVLLARDSADNPVGTLRILDSRAGRIELDSLNPNYRELFPDDASFVEGTRFVALGSDIVPKTAVQAALWRVVFDYATRTCADQIVAWVRKGPDRGYKFLMFTGHPACDFNHQRIGDASHRVYTLDVAQAPALYRCSQHPLYEFFVNDRYQNLEWTWSDMGLSKSAIRTSSHGDS